MAYKFQRGTAKLSGSITLEDNLQVDGTISLANGSLSLAELDIDGGTDIGAALVDADLFIVDDGAGGTNRKSVMSRIPTYLVNHANLTSLTSLAGVGTLTAGQFGTDGSPLTAYINAGEVDGVTIGSETAAAATFTTCDATTDFTIDGLVLTADTITNDAALTVVSTGLTLNASLDIALSADGGNVTMDDGTTTIFDFNVDDTTLTIHDDQDTGDKVVMTMAQHGAFTIETTDDDAAAANILITADGTFEAVGTTITLDSGGNIALEPAAGSHIKLDDVIQVDSGVITGATSITSTAFVGTLSTAAQTNVTSLGTLTALTVDNLTVNGNTITADSGALNLTPAGGSAIVLDSTINIDAGVVTGATSITSTAFVGGISGGTVAGSTGTFSGILKTDDTTAATTTTDGSLQTDGGLSVAGDAVIGDDLMLLSDSAVLNFGADKDITLTHVADTGLLMAGSHANGTNLRLNNSAADGDCTVQFQLGGTTAWSMGVEDGDSDKFVIEDGAGALGADPAFEIAADKSAKFYGTLEATTSFTIGSAALTEAELELLDGITAGTGAEGKALVLDGSRDVDTINALGIASMANNWTNAGRTVADMGILTTVDINGGSIDGATIGAASHSTGKFTTVDATTDFTIDGLVLTADTITNDAALSIVSTGLTLNASLDIALSADGGNVTMDDGTTTVFDFNTDDPELKIMDDAQVANYCSIAVGANGATTFTTVDADAAAANLIITADGTVDIDSAGVLTLDSGAAINLEPAAGSVVLIDGAVSIDAGVVTGITSLTATAIDGVIGGGTARAGTFAAVIGTTGVFSSTLACETSLTIGSAAMSEADLEKLDGITNGIGAANKALVLNDNADIASGLRNVTITGTFSDGNYTFDTSGNVTGLGTVACGAITATGTSTFATACSPDAADGATLGSATAEWSDLYLADGGRILFGNDQDVVLTHEADKGLTLTSADSVADMPDFCIRNTNANDRGPSLTIEHSSSSPANADNVGNLGFKGYDGGGNLETFAEISSDAVVVGHGSEQGALAFKVLRAGGPVEILDLCKTAADTITVLDGAYNFNIASHDGTNGLALAGTIVTPSAADMNILLGCDGNGLVVADLTKLAGVDATAAELNYLDGTAGVSAASKAIVCDGNGDFEMQDSDKIFFGNDADVSIHFDGTTMKIGTDTSGKAITIGHSTSEVTVADNLTITGDLTVNGATITQDVATLTIEDPLVLYSSGQSGSPGVDSGFVVERGDSQNVGFIWDESADVFACINSNETGTTAGNVTIASYAGFKAATLTADILTLDGACSVGLLRTAVNTKEAAATISAGDGGIVLCSAASAAYKLTLPSAADSTAGDMFTIKRTDAATYAITLTASANKIDGEDFVVLESDYAGLQLVSNGTNWYIL